MSKQKAVLRVTVEFDDALWSPDIIARSIDQILERSVEARVLVFGSCEAVPDLSLNPRVTKPEHLCAVLDCGRTGVSATCPYDGSSHGHGRIHYECHERWVPGSRLRFESLAVGGWRLICPEHLDQMNSEIQTEQLRKAERTTT